MTTETPDCAADLELYFVLLPARNDARLSSPAFQDDLRSFASVVRAENSNLSVRHYVHDAIDGGGGLSGEFGILVSSLGPTAVGALATALGAYLKGKFGRKARLRVGLDGEIEAEAQTVEEVRALMKIAAKYRKETSVE